MSEKLIQLEIVDLAFDGKSVAHNNGKVVFLKGGLPGETVLVEIINSKPRYDQGIVRKIIKKSDRRITAPCKHFERCGGCTWQDLIYQDQLDFKKKQVRDCMERIGKLTNVEIKNVVGSVELFAYRNKMEFSFHAGEDGGFCLGLHERGSFDKIFDVDKCLLQSDLASELVVWMRDYVISEEIPVYDVKKHTGYMRFFMIRQAKRFPQLMINIVTNYGDFPNRENFIKQMLERFPEVTTVVHNQNGLKSNIAIGEIERVLYGPGYIEEGLFDYTFRIRANSFFQTNTIQAETLYRYAFEMLHLDKKDRVLDLYCGTGSIGILLARHVQEVIGVELVEDALEVARINARINHVDNISFHLGPVRDFLKSHQTGSDQFDIFIVDPPRAGLHPKALRRIIEHNPPRILYISCNPSTFARDAAKLVDAGYHLPAIQPIDMFPHTMHIELVSAFQRD